jgi:hypothetical protein
MRPEALRQVRGTRVPSGSVSSCIRCRLSAPACGDFGLGLPGGYPERHRGPASNTLTCPPQSGPIHWGVGGEQQPQGFNQPRGSHASNTRYLPRRRPPARAMRWIHRAPRPAGDGSTLRAWPQAGISFFLGSRAVRFTCRGGAALTAVRFSSDAVVVTRCDVPVRCAGRRLRQKTSMSIVPSPLVGEGQGGGIAVSF